MNVVLPVIVILLLATVSAIVQESPDIPRVPIIGNITQSISKLVKFLNGVLIDPPGPSLTESTTNVDILDNCILGELHSPLAESVIPLMYTTFVSVSVTSIQTIEVDSPYIVDNVNSFKPLNQI